MDDIFNELEPLVIRVSGKKYYVKGIEDEPLTSRELSAFLVSNQITIEEIALMRLSFHENPHDNEAHFGLDGYFLFTKRHN